MGLSEGISGARYGYEPVSSSSNAGSHRLAGRTFVLIGGGRGGRTISRLHLVPMWP